MHICVCVYYLLVMISCVVKKSAFQLQNAINLIYPRISSSHTRMCNTSIILMYQQLRYFSKKILLVCQLQFKSAYYYNNERETGVLFTTTTKSFDKLK